MNFINTLRSYEYDRLHSDAVYESTSADNEDGVPPESSRGRRKSETRAAVQSEISAPSTPDASLRRSPLPEGKMMFPTETTANPSNAGAKGASARVAPEDVGPKPEKPTVRAYVNSSSLLIGLLLLGVALFVWYIAL